MIGRLLYFSYTRLGISHSINVLSYKLSKREHMNEIYRIIRYLKMIPEKGLFFKNSIDRGLTIFTDANWAGSVVDKRSHVIFSSWKLSSAYYIVSTYLQSCSSTSCFWSTCAWSFKCVFLGYTHPQKSYHCFSPTLNR